MRGPTQTHACRVPSSLYDISCLLPAQAGKPPTPSTQHLLSVPSILCLDKFEHLQNTMCEFKDACKATYCHTSCSYVLCTSCIRLPECALHQVALCFPADPVFLQQPLLTAEAMCNPRRHSKPTPQLTRKAGASQTKLCSDSAGTNLCHVAAVLSLYGLTTRSLVLHKVSATAWLQPTGNLLVHGPAERGCSSLAALHCPCRSHSHQHLARLSAQPTVGAHPVLVNHV